MISANTALSGSYDYGEVARSVLIAIAASYAALDLAGRVTAARGWVRLPWLSGGAIAMGIGIWSMHFKGMLAFRLPVPVEYHWPTVLASLTVAIFASAFALDLASRRKMGWVEALSGSVVMSVGIAGMHYIGMDAMRLPAITQFSPLLVIVSILFAFTFSLVGLLMAFDLREETRWSVPRRLGSATVMGLAVSAMHYTGMAAASFIPAPPPDLSHAVSISPVGGSGVVLVAVVVLLAAVTTSSVDRQQAREQLRLVVDTIPQQIWSTPPDGLLDFCNAQFRGYVGLTLEELQGEGWQRIVHPDDLERVVKAWRESVTKGTPFEQEARHRQADGQYRCFLVRGVPLRDPDGRIVRWYGTSTDIEDRKRAEDAGRRSEEHLRLVIDTIPQQIMSGPNDGTLDFANAQWRSYTGLTPEELRGRGWQRIIHPDDLEPLLKAVEESRAQGKPYEQEVRRRGADGRYRWFLARGVPLKDPEGHIVRWFGSNTDIQDRKEAENRIRLVIDTAPAMLHSARPDGYVDFFNKRWLEYVGVSLEDIAGWQWTKVIHPEDVEGVVGKWRSSVATGEPFEAEARLRRADGEYRLMLLRKVPLRDEAGSVVKWYGSAFDIEDRKRAEEELKTSEAKHRVIVEAASDAVISMDESGSILLANPATARIFGYNPAELIGKPLTILMPEFMRKLHEAGFRQYLATGQRHLNWQGAEVTALRKNGKEFPVEVSFGEMISNGHKVFTGFIRDISEKKRAEDELRQQKEIFQKIFENIPVTISFVGQDGHIEMVNPEWERTLGWTLEEMRFPEMYPDPQHRQAVLDLIATSTRRWIDRKVRVRDGRVIDMTVAVVNLSDGTRVAIGRDITERKRAEEALRRAADFDEAALKSLGEGLYTLDTNGLVTSMNPAAEELFGWSFGEMRGKKMHDMTHHHYRDGRPFPSSECVGFQVLTHGQPVKNCEDVFIRKDGTFFDVIYSIAPMRDAAGQITGQVVVFSDITERKRAEERLLESEARFRLVADSAPVLIWMSGTDKLCTYFNKPWLDFTGRPPEQELGDGWAEGVHPEDLRRCMTTYIQAFDRREAFRMEYRLRRHDRELRWVLDIGVPRFNPDGSFAGYIGSCIDVTEQRRAEEQLRQAHADLARVTRMAALGELAAAIAHEVNQPLGAVVANASASLRWLAGQPPNLEESREAIERTVREATRASDVIVRIRALLQKGPPQMERLDVNAVIREVLSLAGNEILRGGVAVQTELDPDVPNVLGDRVQLQQVLLNLILNGIDAMSTMTNRSRQLLIKSAKHPQGVLIQIQDSGAGVDPEQADHIFEPFFTTKPQGIGMGLSVVRSIVEAHGGLLWFTSESSHGAVFQFTLPKAD
jgi:PAS domain S-box-containing protein